MLLINFLISVALISAVDCFTEVITTRNSCRVRILMSLKISPKSAVPRYQTYLSSILLDNSPPLVLSNNNNNNNFPWMTSIKEGKSLSYMPMFLKQLDMIKQQNFDSESVDEKFTFKSSDVKPARISSLCFKNEKFRKVRMTYIDAGESVQV